MPTVKLICTTALKSSLDDMLADFERANGVRVETSYGPSAQLTKRLVEGEAADAVVLTPSGIDEMTRLRKIVSGTIAEIARSDTMVAVRQGTPRPDISTAEKFKQAMLAAKSIAYSGPGAGASGAHIAKVIERLGIADALRAKTVLGSGGPAGLIGNYLVRGEAELGMQQDSELMSVPGVDILGPLPGELALTTAFVFALHAGAAEPAGGTAIGALLRSPAARAVMKSKGLTPA